MKRIAQLDGLRGVAILGVLLAHFGANLIPSGGTALYVLKKCCLTCGHGVDLFFVLSGFLIGGILLDQRRSQNLLTVFYVRRTLRILPVYFAVLALLSLMQALRGDAWWDALFARQLPAWVYLTFTQNILFVVRGWDAVALTPSWSLAMEEQFYLVLPALILWLPPRQLPWVMLALIGLASLLRAVLVLGFPGYPLAPYMLLPCRWEPMLLGVLAAWAVRTEGVDQALRDHCGWFYVVAGLSGLLWGLVVFGPEVGTLRPTLGLSAVGVFCLSVFVLALYDPRVARCFDISLLRWLGAVSYGIYLFHQGVNGLLFCWLKGGQAAPGLADAGITVLAVLMTLGLAALSYRYFETPLIRLSHRWKYAPAAVPEAILHVEQFSITVAEREMLAAAPR